MTTVLCTLYNSLYLDKGLVMYDSLCECAKDFKLYVLCMDDKCYEVLGDIKQNNLIPIRLADFEAGDEELLTAKSSRSIGEYCWTCSSSLIRFVLLHCDESSCTYIDADMFFYKDPQVLIEEMMNVGKSVMVVPHRFPDEIKDVAKTVGTYCVEFNTFLNNEESISALNYWRSRCLECCSNLGDGIHWGDQKYLEEIVDRFDCAYVCQNTGAGVAPWNIPLYKEGDINSIVFYHFQSVAYINRHRIDSGIKANRRDVDYALVDRLYVAYLSLIEGKKKILEEKYGIKTIIRSHPASKKDSHIKRILKKTVLYKIYYSRILKGDVPYIISI